MWSDGATMITMMMIMMVVVVVVAGAAVGLGDVVVEMTDADGDSIEDEGADDDDEDGDDGGCHQLVLATCPIQLLRSLCLLNSRTSVALHPGKRRPEVK